MRGFPKGHSRTRPFIFEREDYYTWKSLYPGKLLSSPAAVREWVRRTAGNSPRRALPGILVADLNLEDAQNVCDKIMAAYPACKCVAVKTDVSKEADVDHCFEVLEQEFGTLDILVNNAGVTNKIPFDEMTLKHWEFTYGINITGPFLFCQRALRIMKAKGYGRIINMASVAGHVGGLTSGVDYATTKGAMLTLTRSVAKQGAAYGVTCQQHRPRQHQNRYGKGLRQRLGPHGHPHAPAGRG